MREGLRLKVSSETLTAPAATSRGGAPAMNIDAMNVEQEEGAVSDKPFPSSKKKLDELFLQWISLPDSQRLVMNLLEDAKHGKPLIGPQNAANVSPLSPSSTSALFATTPPLSPQKAGSSPRSPMSPTKRSTSMSKPPPRGAHLIQQFYFPNGRPPLEEQVAAVKAKLTSIYGKNSFLTVEHFSAVTTEVAELPQFFNALLFAKVDAANSGMVTRDQFEEYWEARLERKCAAGRVFEVLRADDAATELTHDDFKPLLRIILNTHPGLDFLKEAPEFQDRYAETVIYRIFYSVNTRGNRKISLRELKRSDLMEAMAQLGEEEDINKVYRYFSYEHFYVVYCKFWELDRDHDFLIDKDDLSRYGNHALTYRIVDRIFSQAPRKFVNGSKDKMGYEDFVWFILSEEDKTTALSLEYWFACIDRDSAGKILPIDMRYFYEEQLHRMECLSQEPVLFDDVLCQLSDMVKPAEEGTFTLRDLKNCKLSGNFFNILFNLNKFIAFETRDPFLIRQEREDMHLTEWDRFARTEYIRLSMEEEEQGEEAAQGSAEVLDEPIGAF